MQPSGSSQAFFPKDSRNVSFLLLLALLALLLLFFSFSFSFPSSPISFSPSPPSSSLSSSPSFLSHSPSLPPPPSLAYLLSASSHDFHRLFRLLLSVYHPNNLYLLHLDLTASDDHRRRLALQVRAVPAFRSAANVHVIGKADFAYRGGSSALSAILHGAAVLLRIGKKWDWFLNLDASDYPIVTQDDLLHVFSFLPRDLNFVQHSSYIGWRESRRLKPIIVDPGLYLSSKAEMFYATQKRELPNAYKVFTGSSSVILSRKFIEYCILGTDNLPRILLMYYANTPSSHTNYFQTLLCNSHGFNRTILNHDLHYITWDNPPKREPRVLSLDDLKNMTESGSAFAARFSRDDPTVLDHIDREILNRGPNNIVPGGWCLGSSRGNPCTVWGKADVLRPGPGAVRLSKAIVHMLSDGSFESNRCIWNESM